MWSLSPGWVVEMSHLEPSWRTRPWYNTKKNLRREVCDVTSDLKNHSWASSNLDRNVSWMCYRHKHRTVSWETRSRTHKPGTWGEFRWHTTQYASLMYYWYQIDGRLLRYLPSDLPVSIHQLLPWDIELLIDEPVDEPEEEPVVSYLFVWELQTWCMHFMYLSIYVLVAFTCMYLRTCILMSVYIRTPTVHIPVHGTSVSYPSHTLDRHMTAVNIQWNHHCRDCLYRKTYDTEHKFWVVRRHDIISGREHKLHNSNSIVHDTF